ncbi:MAG: hypothetical protein PHV16_01245 [Candidatus Nanoarchaeia archaeon]|nr:hypothetical protein [Candidatus Nanoarchaeia archaeon]
MKILFIFSFLILMFPLFVCSIGVSPTEIDFKNLSNGEKQKSYLTVFNTLNEEASYSLNVKNNHEIFYFYPTEFSVPANQNKKIEVVVEIPYDMHEGYYSDIIYVNEVQKSNEKTSVSPSLAVKASFFVEVKESKESSFIESLKNNSEFNLNEIFIVSFVIIAGAILYVFEKEKSIFDIFN